MKKQRLIHLSSAVLHATGILVGWRYLPPWLLHNPGVVIIVITLVVVDVLHVVFHEK